MFSLDRYIERFKDRHKKKPSSSPASVVAPPVLNKARLSEERIRFLRRLRSLQGVVEAYASDERTTYVVLENQRVVCLKDLDAAPLLESLRDMYRSITLGENFMDYLQGDSHLRQSTSREARYTRDSPPPQNVVPPTPDMALHRSNSVPLDSHPHGYSVFSKRRMSSKSSSIHSTSAKTQSPQGKKGVHCSENLERYLHKNNIAACSSGGQKSPISKLISGSLSSLEGSMLKRKLSNGLSNLNPLSGLKFKVKSRGTGVVLPPRQTLTPNSNPETADEKHANERTKYSAWKQKFFNSLQESFNHDGTSIFVHTPRLKSNKPGPYFDEDHSHTCFNNDEATRFREIFIEKFNSLSRTEGRDPIKSQKKLARQLRRQKKEQGRSVECNVDFDEHVNGQRFHEMVTYHVTKTQSRKSTPSPQPVRESPTRYIRVESPGLSPPIIIPAATTLGGLPEPYLGDRSPWELLHDAACGSPTSEPINDGVDTKSSRVVPGYEPTYPSETLYNNLASHSPDSLGDDRATEEVLALHLNSAMTLPLEPPKLSGDFEAPDSTYLPPEEQQGTPSSWYPRITVYRRSKDIPKTARSSWDRNANNSAPDEGFGDRVLEQGEVEEIESAIGNSSSDDDDMLTDFGGDISPTVSLEEEASSTNSSNDLVKTLLNSQSSGDPLIHLTPGCSPSNTNAQLRSAATDENGNSSANDLVITLFDYKNADASFM